MISIHPSAVVFKASHDSVVVEEPVAAYEPDGSVVFTHVFSIISVWLLVPLRIVLGTETLTNLS